MTRDVKLIKHTSGVQVQLTFDPNDMHFSAVVAGCTFRGKDGEQLCRTVIEFLDKSTSIEWVPVIEIRKADSGYMSQCYCHDDRMRHKTGFTADRFYLAIKPDGSACQLSWDNYHNRSDAERLNSASWYGRIDQNSIKSLPIIYDKEDWRTILAYTEETWAGLVQLYDALERLDIRIVAMFVSADGHSRIAKAGANVQRLLDEG